MSLILAMIIGVLVGFLINYFADVLPEFRSITRPLCESCKEPYSIKDYLLSFQCSRCGHRVSARKFIVLITAIIACVLLLSFPFSDLGFWETLPILVFLGVIMVIDIEHHLVLWQTSLFGVALFAVYGFFLHGVAMTFLGALGGFLVTLSFFLLGMAFSAIAGRIRRKQIDEVAFGFGDVLVGTFLGMLAGWPAIAAAILIGIFTFSAFSVALVLILLLTKRYQAFSHPQPFTLFLILGTIAIFYL